MAIVVCHAIRDNNHVNPVRDVFNRQWRYSHMTTMKALAPRHPNRLTIVLGSDGHLSDDESSSRKQNKKMLSTLN